MSRELAIESVRAAASAAGDVSGNCDAAYHYAQREAFADVARQLEWAEDNARSMLHRIKEARAAIQGAQR